ncbi:carbohydrate ABC transporter permease [Lederbergia citri]|uniref:Sugar ABC transporter permease n=1 Tax=Lederbergia citri TaxID=2833580 RepID=A0A942TCY0_9BACI|nr:sugar ABC transporter permease [Lederbergia citri]MBS4195596.1 sugar ABC transporter permease [Lederbergia citri]
MKGKFINDVKAIPFLLPFFLVYAVFTIFPILKGLEMSFYDWTIIRKMDFIALDHYKELIADKNFWKSLWNTTLFVLLSTPTMVILALILALMANRHSKFRTFYRSTFFLPSILSVSVISYIAIFMLQPYQGFVNTTLHLFGIDNEPFWLKDTNLAWFSIVAVTLWWTVGFNMVLFLAALQDIPEELYEAARIDGGKSSQLLRHITLPLLIPIGRVVLLLQILASYKVFAQILLITGGGPGTATRPLIQYIYEIGFRQNNLGYAAALSYALFVILLILSLIQLKGNMIQGGAQR